MCWSHAGVVIVSYNNIIMKWFSKKTFIMNVIIMIIHCHIIFDVYLKYSTIIGNYVMNRHSNIRGVAKI